MTALGYLEGDHRLLYMQMSDNYMSIKPWDVKDTYSVHVYYPSYLPSPPSLEFSECERASVDFVSPLSALLIL